MPVKWGYSNNLYDIFMPFCSRSLEFERNHDEISKKSISDTTDKIDWSPCHKDRSCKSFARHHSLRIHIFSKLKDPLYILQGLTWLYWIQIPRNIKKKKVTYICIYIYLSTLRMIELTSEIYIAWLCIMYFPSWNVRG